MLRLTLYGGFFLTGSHGAEVPLKSRKAKALLAYLALSPGKARSREEIMALLWSDRGQAQARASLRQVLTGLRKDLGEEATAALIVTNDAVALRPDNVTLTAENPDEQLLAGFHLNDPAFEEWLRDERQSREDEPLPNDNTTTDLDAKKPSVAFLPFANLSGDPEQEYFSDGLTQDVTNQLARFRSLVVIGSTSTLLYKESTPQVHDIARELDVDYVAKGSVRKAGNSVRITVELVEADKGQQLWAERYDRELEDIFSVQDEVAGKIVSTLAGHIEDADLQRAKSKHSHDLAAYELVLLGEKLEREYTREGVLGARSLYRKAIARDPDNARAHASMARTFLDEIWSFWSADWDAAADQAFVWAQKAVALDGLDNRARANLGVAYHVAKGNFDAAHAQFEKALELNSNDADAYCLRGWCHVLAGETEQAIMCADRAIRLSPLSTYDCQSAQFAAHYIACRYEEAVKCLGYVEEPGFEIDAYRAACYAQLGRDGDAKQAMENFMKEAVRDIAEWPGDDPVAWQTFWGHLYPFQDSRNLEHLLDGLRKAGLPV